MTTRPTPRALPSVALRGRSASAWLEPGALLLEQGGLRRRIPLSAVEQALVQDSRGRKVRIVLTAPEGTEPTAYEVENRNVTAVAAFASAVNGALPPRDADARRQDGSELVEETPAPARSRHHPDPLLSAVVVVIGLYVAGLATLIAHGDLVGVIFWILGVKPLIAGAYILSSALGNLYDRAILRHRGITALATYHHHEGKKQLFVYTDVDGTDRYTEPDSAAIPVSTSPTRVQITYDPRNRDRAAAALPLTTWAARTVGVVFFAIPMLLLGLYLIPYQLVELLLL